MAYNGSGTFLRIHDWEADRDAGIKIRADRHDQQDDDFAAGLSNAITKDGQTQPVADLPMNGKKFTNLGAPANPGDSATKSYVDAIKKFTNDIEVTDEVIFKDGTTTRGFIKGAIGTGVNAELLFEADNDAGALVNRFTLDNNGLNLRTNGYRLTPNGVLRASLYPESSATPAVYLRAYDATGVEKALYAVTNGSAYLKTSDVAITAYSLQFRQSDNVQRGGIISDFAPTDGATTIFIKNGAGTTRNNLTLDINGATLTTGVYSAPAWTFPAGTVTMSGVVTLSAQLQLSGTSAAAGTALIQMKDTRATTGAEGNNVFAITRQNSSTDCLMLGNDANNAALIGSNNTVTRLGKWVAGAFTEYMRINNDGTITITEGSVTYLLGTNGLEITSASPRVMYRDNTASSYDFWTYVDGSTFYILVDRNDDGSWDTPHPLALNATNNTAQLFGAEIITQANLQVSNIPSTTASTPSTIVERDGAGDMNARLFKSEYDTTNPSIGYIMTQVDTISNNYMRPSTPAQVAAAIQPSLPFAGIYTGSTQDETNFPIGHSITMITNTSQQIARNAAFAPYLNSDTAFYCISTTGGVGAALSGTYRARGKTIGASNNIYYHMQRVA